VALYLENLLLLLQYHSLLDLAFHIFDMLVHMNQLLFRFNIFPRLSNVILEFSSATNEMLTSSDFAGLPFKVALVNTLPITPREVQLIFE
jgi:hypothetical protein